MAKVKTTSEKVNKKMRPALSEEAREKQLISLAYDAAEKSLRDGTASSQVITHFLKLGTEKEKLEREKLERENTLLGAKTEAIKSQKRIEELYSEALKSMQLYAGQTGDVVSDEEFEED